MRSPGETLALIKEAWAYTEKLRELGLPWTPADQAKLQARARFLRTRTRSKYAPSEAMGYAKKDYNDPRMPHWGFCYRPGERP